ncbi:hypothetical protein HKD37_18G051045 [Glycine soja]
MLSTPSNLPFFIDAIETRWEHDDTLHMDHFYGFLYCRCAPIDVPRYKSAQLTFTFGGSNQHHHTIASSCLCQRSLFLLSHIHYLQMI